MAIIHQQINSTLCNDQGMRDLTTVDRMLVNRVFTVIYTLAKVRGYKTIGKYRNPFKRVCVQCRVLRCGLQMWIWNRELT